MAIIERKMGVWLTLWGIFVALLIQVIYDWGFAFPVTMKTAIGFGIACFGLVPLGVYAVNGFQWKKGNKPSNPPNESEKKDKPKTVEQINLKNEEREYQLEMLKIQIYTDRCHALFTSSLSFGIAFFSLVAVFYAVFYQGTTSQNMSLIFTGYIGILIITGASVYFFYKLKQRYTGITQKISDMIKTVGEGKKLPNLDQLDNWKMNTE